jgi:predicted NBD/HSP70 family sugar kinase
VVDSVTGVIRLTHFATLEEVALRDELEDRLGARVTMDNDINFAALGEQWRGSARGVEDFAFLSVGTGLGAGIVLRGEIHRGRNGAAGEVDLVTAGVGDDFDPCASALAVLAAERAEGADTMLTAPFDAPTIFAAARSGDQVAQDVVQEEARRIAMHIAPITAVADLPLVVLGGGIGTNGDLLVEPVRRMLSEWLPFPPQVEVSSLGDAAVLSGALALGLRHARDNVFARRRG